MDCGGKFLQRVLRQRVCSGIDRRRHLLHKAARLLAALHRDYHDSAQRAFIATYKQHLSLIDEDFQASLRSLQKTGKVYQHVSTTDFHGDCKLFPSRSNALNAPPAAMSISVTGLVKGQDWGSHKVSSLDMEPLFAPQISGVASHDDEVNINVLLDLLSHRRAEAVQNYATCGAHRTSVRDQTRNEKDGGTQHIPISCQGSDSSSHCTLSTPLVWMRHASDED